MLLYGAILCGKTTGAHGYGPTAIILHIVKWFPWLDAMLYGIPCLWIRYSVSPLLVLWLELYVQERKAHTWNKYLLNTCGDQLLPFSRWNEYDVVTGRSAWGIMLYWGLNVGLCYLQIGCSERAVAWLGFGKWESMPPSLLLFWFLPHWLLYSCPHHANSGVAHVNSLSHFVHLVIQCLFYIGCFLGSINTWKEFSHFITVTHFPVFIHLPPPMSSYNNL